MNRCSTSILSLVLATAPVCSIALAGPPPSYDFDWATVGDTGNAPYPGDDQGRLKGRGGVNYSYRISKLEVTTGQWMEFVNTFSTQSNDLRFFADPVFWGAEPDPTYQGAGRRWRLRQDVAMPEMLPVSGISWRESAQFCNWLHNDKGSNLADIADGAYDTSTFTLNTNNTFNDQRTHHPDAKFWIPTLDEWIKAAHYDPNRFGQGKGGWWTYSNSSDTPYTYGPPGKGEANAGFTLPDAGQWDIPLGAYNDVQTPWGLLDAAGATSEWTEEVFFPNSPRDRGLDGSAANDDLYLAELNDQTSRIRSLRPWAGASGSGFRVVSQVPSPTAAMLLPLLTATYYRRREHQ